MPSSASIGSYKNPELVAKALTNPLLKDLHLVITSPSSAKLADTIRSVYPSIKSRVHYASFTNTELKLAYQTAVAVVIPSRAEGFGLPCVEAMASGGITLVSDVIGLREAGSEASLRFTDNSPDSLSSYLALLINPSTGPYFRSILRRRAPLRLHKLHPHLFALCLLTASRLSLAKRRF